MTAFLEVFWKSGAILGTALCVTLLLRKRSAAARRLVLSAAIVATLLATLASPLLPRVDVPEPAWLMPAESASLVSAPMPGVRLTAGTIAHSSAPMPSAAPHTQLPETIPLIWLLVTTLLLTRLSLGLYGLRRMRSAARPLSGEVLQSDSVGAPVTWGIVHPVILVPAGFEALREESRDAVLCHERAHIQANDFLFRLLAEITRTLIWFQPLMWIVSRRLREEQELVCDDRVLASGVKPSAYAKLLLNWDLTPATPAIGMAGRGCLKRRLYALLDGDTRRAPLNGAVVLTTWVLALAAALPLAAMSWARPAEPIPAERPRIRKPAAPQSIRLAQARSAPDAASRVSGKAPLAFFAGQSMLIVEDVTVTSRDAASVQGLSADDFIVTEDGKPMRPVFAERGSVLFEQQGLASAAIADYRLGYYTTNDKADGTYRTVTVSMRTSNAKVSYRGGFSAPVGTPAGAYLPINRPPGTVPPELVSKVEPAYSDEARRAKLSGSVTLEAAVDESGKATNIHVTRPLGSGLDENAMDALRKWRFRPASQDSVPVSAPIRVEMSFYLP